MYKRQGVRRLPRQQADEVRTEASRILARAKPPRCNIPVGELRALRTLRRDESIIILPADKGSATVVMNTDDYQRKIGELLDPETYKKLRRDPTAVVLKRTDFLVKRSSLAVSYTHLDVYKRQLQANGYSVGEVRRAVRPRRTARPEVDSRETVGFAALPYICLLYTSRCV